MIPVEEHRSRCLATLSALTAARVDLLQACGRVLAEPVEAEVAIPGFDNSAMDGYAVRLADLTGASEQEPVRLPVTGDLPAGTAPSGPLAEGSAVRIMTGAPVPVGTEAIVPVEWTDAGTDQVLVSRRPEPGQYLRRAGEDVTSGEQVLSPGAVLTARHVGLLAAVGRGQVSVVPAPRVAVLSTGSELVPPGRRPGPGQIHDSNSFALTAAAQEAGALAWRLPTVADDPEAFATALGAAADSADLVVTSGGVSAGAYDTVKAVLSAQGQVRFDKVAVQPGMPQGFGLLERPGGRRVPVFTLPGNPVSSMVSFELFVRPAVRRLAGHHVPATGPAWSDRRSVRAAAGTSWSSPRGKLQVVRGVLRTEADQLVVDPVGGQGSHLVADLAEATCLALVPAGVETVAPGDRLTCLVLS